MSQILENNMQKSKKPGIAMQRFAFFFPYP